VLKVGVRDENTFVRELIENFRGHPWTRPSITTEPREQMSPVA